MQHPFLRGALLALTLAAAMTLGAPVDAHPVQLAMILPGAFLASVPERIRRRGQVREKRSAGRCVRCLWGGFLTAAGCRLAGGGWPLQWTLALGTGGAGSVGFAAAAIICALLLSWAGRRQPA